MNRTSSVPRCGMPVYSTGGAVVGEITKDNRGERWLEKHGLDPAKHQLRKPPAWCTDASHLELLRETGAAGVKLTTKTGIVWRARLEKFDRFGFPVNRRHGRQVGLALMHWETEDPRAGRQMTLFGLTS